MMKVYSFLLAAVALVGFAACNQDFTADIAPESGEMVSFKATIADETRVGLDGLQTVWEDGDEVKVDGYTFICQSDLETFVCNEVGCSVLVEEGRTVDAVYAGKFDLSGEGVIDSTKGTAGAVLTAKGSLTEGALSFQIQSAFLKFTTTTSSNVVLNTANGDELFSEHPIYVDKLTAAEDGFYYVAINPVSATLSYSINGIECKKITKTFEAGKIYNLGALEPVEMTTVYLVPGVWASDNAIFTVYYWDGEYNNEVEMTKDDTKSGVYKADVRATSDGLIFKRLDPTNKKEWNKTADLTLPTDSKDHYYITGWPATGEWKEYVVTEWALAGTFNSWSDAPMTRINASISYVANVNLTAYNDQFKVKVNGDANWTTSYGAGYGYMMPNRFMTATFGGGDIAVTVTGAYDIYFDEVNTLIYVVTAGSDYTTAVEQTANGPAPVVGNMYYFKPNSNWTQSNAKFSAYFWNNGGNKWAELVDGDGDGVYECNLGEWTPTSVIFLRKDPTGFVYNNWTCWNRIGNITVKSGMNFYTMANGVWSQQIESGNGYTGGTWTKK